MFAACTIYKSIYLGLIHASELFHQDSILMHMAVQYFSFESLTNEMHVLCNTVKLLQMTYTQ